MKSQRAHRSPNITHRDSRGGPLRHPISSWVLWSGPRTTSCLRHFLGLKPSTCSLQLPFTSAPSDQGDGVVGISFPQRSYGQSSIYLPFGILHNCADPSKEKQEKNPETGAIALESLILGNKSEHLMQSVLHLVPNSTTSHGK